MRSEASSEVREDPSAHTIGPHGSSRDIIVRFLRATKPSARAQLQHDARPRLVRPEICTGISLAQSVDGAIADIDVEHEPQRDANQPEAR